VFDIDAMAHLALAGAKASASVRRDFMKGVKQQGFGNQMCATVGQAGTYRLLRVRSDEIPRRSVARSRLDRWLHPSRGLERALKALDRLDRLDRRVGGDPYLDALRATSHHARDDLDQALRHARSATTRDPSIQASWWALINVLLARNELDEALAGIDKLGRRFGVQIDEDEMAKLDIHQGLLASPQWKRWKAARPPSPTGGGQK